MLYRPQGEGLAASIAFRPKIDAVRPLTEADEERIHVDVSAADVVVVYGPDAEERLLSDPRVCAPAGGELKLCVDRSDEQRYSALVLGDRPLSVAPVDERGWWSWVALAPDGRTILAQWSGDCGPVFAIDAAGGDPRKLGAGKAVGWTTAGDPLLYVPPRCGEPGTYRVAADGERERLAAGRLEPSHSPREVG